jgi:hypothetical protein
VDFLVSRVSSNRSNKYGLQKESAAEIKTKGREKLKGEKERRKERKTCIIRTGNGE